MILLPWDIHFLRVSESYQIIIMYANSSVNINWKTKAKIYRRCQGVERGGLQKRLWHFEWGKEKKGKLPGKDNELPSLWRNQWGLATCKSWLENKLEGLLRRLGGRCKSLCGLWKQSGSHLGLSSHNLTHPDPHSHPQATWPVAVKGDQHFLPASKIWWVLQGEPGKKQTSTRFGGLRGGKVSSFRSVPTQ